MCTCITIPLNKERERERCTVYMYSILLARSSIYNVSTIGILHIQFNTIQSIIWILLNRLKIKETETEREREIHTCIHIHVHVHNYVYVRSYLIAYDNNYILYKYWYWSQWSGIWLHSTIIIIIMLLSVTHTVALYSIQWTHNNYIIVHVYMYTCIVYTYMYMYTCAAVTCINSYTWLSTGHMTGL